MTAPFGTDVNRFFNQEVLQTLLAAFITRPEAPVAHVSHGLLTGTASPLSVFWTVATAIKSEEVLNEAIEIYRRKHQCVPNASELREQLRQVLEILGQNSVIQHTLMQFAALMAFIQETNPAMANSLTDAYTQATQPVVIHDPKIITEE